MMGRRTQETKVLVEKAAISVVNTSWEKPWEKPWKNLSVVLGQGLKKNPLSIVGSYEMLPKFNRPGI